MWRWACPLRCCPFSGKLSALLPRVGGLRAGGVATVCTPSLPSQQDAAKLLEIVRELLLLVSGAQLQKLARFEALGRVDIA